MARIFGRRGSLVALGILGLIALAPLAVYSPILALVALAALAVLATGLAHRRATALAARCDKLSAEIDVVSKRLLRIEGAAKAGQFQHPAPGADAAALAAGVEEVTVEIGLLSSIVRDLAAVVATQDSEIAQLKTVAEAPPVAVEPVLPPPPVVAPPAPSAPPQRSAVAPSGAPKPLVMTPRSMPPMGP
jgi:cyclic-di-GMP phosphodiesterase TipF (flagellum assembly factor)